MTECFTLNTGISSRRVVSIAHIRKEAADG